MRLSQQTLQGLKDTGQNVRCNIFCLCDSVNLTTAHGRIVMSLSRGHIVQLQTVMFNVGIRNTRHDG